MSRKYRIDVCVICGLRNPDFAARPALPRSEAIYWTCSEHCRGTMQLVLDLEAELGIREAALKIHAGAERAARMKRPA